MAKTKSIILNSDDMPTYKEIIDTVSRLRKDHTLLSKVRGAKDVEDPDSIKRVASFLEMLANREKKNLPKKDSTIDTSYDLLIDMVCKSLLQMDKWELDRTLEETGLGKILRTLV